MESRSTGFWVKEISQQLKKTYLTINTKVLSQAYVQKSFGILGKGMEMLPCGSFMSPCKSLILRSPVRKPKIRINTQDQYVKRLCVFVIKFKHILYLFICNLFIVFKEKTYLQV